MVDLCGRCVCHTALPGKSWVLKAKREQSRACGVGAGARGRGLGEEEPRAFLLLVVWAALASEILPGHLVPRFVRLLPGTGRLMKWL